MERRIFALWNLTFLHECMDGLVNYFFLNVKRLWTEDFAKMLKFSNSNNRLYLYYISRIFMHVHCKLIGIHFVKITQYR